MAMNNTTLAASLMPGGVMAIDWDGAQALLGQPVPAVASETEILAASGEAVRVGPGERFAILRGVAVMPVRGILTPNSTAFERYLGWATYDGIEESCAALAADDSVKAVCLPVDSVGGLVAGCEGAALAIHDLAQVKPVHVLINPTCASAAYWLASQATEISITAGGQVGSIGAMAAASQYVAPNGAGEQWGRFLSPNAQVKRVDPTTEEGKAEMARALGEAEAIFHAAIVRGRGGSVPELIARLSVSDDPKDGGAMFWGQAGVDRGLADRVEARAEFFARIFAAVKPDPAPVKGRSARADAARADAIRAEAKSV